MASRITVFRDASKPILEDLNRNFEQGMRTASRDIQEAKTPEDLLAALYQASITVGNYVTQKYRGSDNIGGTANLGFTVATLAFHDISRLFGPQPQPAEIEEAVAASTKLCNLLTTVDLETCGRLERVLGLMSSDWSDSKDPIAAIHDQNRSNNFTRQTGTIDIVEAVKPKVTQILARPDVQPGYCPAKSITESYLRIVGDVSKQVLHQTT